jgi:hypothetical protein
MAKDAGGHGSDGRGSNPRGDSIAHQSGIDKLTALGKSFAKSETGYGKSPKFLEDFDIRNKSAESIASVGRHLVESLADNKIDPHTLVHFAHFLGFLGAVAIGDVLAHGVAVMVGYPL